MTIKNNIEKLVSDLDTYISENSAIFDEYIETISLEDIDIGELWNQTKKLCNIKEDNMAAIHANKTNASQCLAHVLGYDPLKTPYEYKIDTIHKTQAFAVMNSDDFVKIDIMHRVLQFIQYKTMRTPKEICLNNTENYNEIAENIVYLKKNDKKACFLGLTMRGRSRSIYVSPYMNNLILKCLLNCKKLPWGARKNYAIYKKYSFEGLYNIFIELTPEEQYVFEQITGFQFALSLASMLNEAYMTEYVLKIISEKMATIINLPNIYGKIHFITEAVKELLRLDAKALRFDIETFYLLMDMASCSCFLSDPEVDFPVNIVLAENPLCNGEESTHIHTFNKEAKDKNFSVFHTLEQCFAALLYSLAKKQEPSNLYGYMEKILRRYMKDKNLLKYPMDMESHYIKSIKEEFDFSADARCKNNILFANVESSIYTSLHETQ